MTCLVSHFHHHLTTILIRCLIAPEISFFSLVSMYFLAYLKHGPSYSLHVLISPISSFLSLSLICWRLIFFTERGRDFIGGNPRGRAMYIFEQRWGKLWGRGHVRFTLLCALLLLPYSRTITVGGENANVWSYCIKSGSWSYT